MAVWATKRRFIYGGSTILVLALIFGGIFWSIIYKAPSCSDGKKNGDETGVDCGGSCKNLCSAETLTPVVLWSKVFPVSGDLYTAVAYIQNPNINSKNPNATYEFRIYDTNNKLIITKEGQTSIPKNKKFAVFETGLVLKNSKPKSADFKFTSFSPWEKDAQKDPNISINYGTLTATTTTPRIAGTISNLSLQTISAIELDVFVLDSKENVVAASRSFIDNLLKSSTQDFVFTWPKPFNLGVEACISPLDITLALDKSGSMKSDGINPPEPFTTVLSTAKDFIKNLTDNDQISVISFGFNPNTESYLSLNKQDSILAINNLVFPSVSEDTYITGALNGASIELQSTRARQNSKKVIILLTDGIPTEGESLAETAAQNLKSLDISIYTIGLGKNVNEKFLQLIATDELHYFFAPTKETLGSIYSKIGTSLCPKKPNVITVIYRII